MEQCVLLEQARQLILLQPGLSFEEITEGIVFAGGYILNCSYNDVPLYDEYQVKIIVPREFPLAIPSFWETNGKLSQLHEFGHFLSNGEMCLGATCDLISCLVEGPTITHYVCSLLNSYFYLASYFNKYGVIPDFGERSHGVNGLIEAYKDRYGTLDDNLLIKLLLYLSKIRPYRGHTECPCGSGRRFRECHGQKILQDLNSEYYVWLFNDAVTILHHFYEERQSKNEQT